MTHPLTPREKVADRGPAGAVMDALWPILGGDQMDAETWTEISKAVGTALAYGSGDHEELARLAGAATPGPWFETEGHPSGRAYGIHAEAATVVVFRGIAKPHGQGEHNAAFIAAANPATVLALLAENAALRAAKWEVKHVDTMNDMVLMGMARDDAETRATEAECKLAEAVGLNDRAAELMRQCTDPERFEGASTLNVYANMRAWLSDLSKEAERG